MARDTQTVPPVKACCYACIASSHDDLRCCYAARYIFLRYMKTSDSVVRCSLLIVCGAKVNKGEVLVDVEQRVNSSLYYSKSVRVSFYTQWRGGALADFAFDKLRVTSGCCTWIGVSRSSVSTVVGCVNWSMWNKELSCIVSCRCTRLCDTLWSKLDTRIKKTAGRQEREKISGR